MRALVCLLVGLLFGAPALLAQNQVQDVADIQRLLNSLLEAVENSDMPAFIVFFDKDATMFHSLAQTPGTSPRRLDGRAEIERSLRAVFDQVKANSDRTTGPYIQIQPLHLTIQTFDQFAVVSFHLDSEPTIHRRTLVFRKIGSGWTIVHLHASQLQTVALD